MRPPGPACSAIWRSSGDKHLTVSAFAQRLKIHGRQNMKNETDTTTSTKQVHLMYRSPYYWRVTFDHPPLNIFGPETIPQLNEVITALETDKDVKVVVFDSAVEGFFLTHYNFLARLEDTTSLPPGPTGLQPLPDMLVRLSRAPVVSIASIRGRATGVGSELALACDMRFASRERAILSQWEVGAGLVPGGGPMARLPRLIGRGRALEVLVLFLSGAAVVPLVHHQVPDQLQLPIATKWPSRGSRSACHRPGQAHFRHRSRAPELTRSTQLGLGSGGRAYRAGAANLWARAEDWLYPQVLQENCNESERTLRPRCQTRPL